MKKKTNTADKIETEQPAKKEQFLKELDDAEAKKVAGGYSVCMNGCGGRCGGCNCISTSAW